jgi:gamma-glutamyltranspeptidase / glutathione hydrolase
MSETVRSRWTFGKTEVTADGGMVTAGHSLAAEAGAEMLRLGGNAIDAAVATAWAVGVVEPWMSGIGGVGAMVVHHDGKETAIDFGMTAPLTARSDMYVLENESEPQGQWGWPSVRGQENELGHRSVGVPGVVAGLCTAHGIFGKLPAATVMAPAIHLARNGFDADWYTTLMVGLHLEVLAHFPNTAAIFLRDGKSLPRPSVLLSQPDRILQGELADTLGRIAKGGAEAFYEGETARLIADDMSAHGGLLTAEDLKAYKPRVYPGGLRGSYRGFDIIGVPGPTGSPILQEILNIVEFYDLATFGFGSARSQHLIAEACRRAYSDTFQFVGDPDVNPVPLNGLLSKAYAEAVRQGIQLDRATITPQPVDPWSYDGEGGSRRVESTIAGSSSQTTSHTTHLCAVDSKRNGVSLTQTLGHLFGSTVTVPKTGVLLNDMMIVFDPRPGRPNSISGGKQQATPVAPTVLLRDGRLHGVIGAPGGRRIPTALAQVIINLVDHGMEINGAIAAPRLHSEGAEMLVDDRTNASTVEELVTLGHEVVSGERSVCSFNYAQPSGVIVRNDGSLAGGTDPFMPGAAVGTSAKVG